MSLNELKNDMAKVIAPTDSRFRTDIRQLELGDLGILWFNIFVIIWRKY